MYLIQEDSSVLGKIQTVCKHDTVTRLFPSYCRANLIALAREAASTTKLCLVEVVIQNP